MPITCDNIKVDFCLCDLTGVETSKKLAVVNTDFLFCYGKCIRRLFFFTLHESIFRLQNTIEFKMS